MDIKQALILIESFRFASEKRLKEFPADREHTPTANYHYILGFEKGLQQTLDILRNIDYKEKM